MKKSHDAALLQLSSVPSTEEIQSVFISLKPGAHFVAICSPMNYHRVAICIEDAGFEIRDQLMWIGEDRVTSVVLARVPLSEDTVAANVLNWGTGGINVDGCRIGTTESLKRRMTILTSKGIPGGGFGAHQKRRVIGICGSETGRWPANVILTKAAGERLDEQTGVTNSPKPYTYHGTKEDDAEIYGKGIGRDFHQNEYGDSGGASRFFKSCDTLEELIEYLTVMILPPGGLLLT